MIAEMTEYSETDNEEIMNARKLFREKEAEIKQKLAPEADKVRELGGLFVLGTERHESRRIDNQLRGRSGRQGDVGTSVFYLSLEDDLMRLFGTDRVATLMSKSLPEDMPIDARILSNAIQRAQQNIENHHFSQRKSTLAYDAVNATVRDSIYDQRDDILVRTDFTSIYDNMCRKFIEFALYDARDLKYMPIEVYEQLKAKEKELLCLVEFPDYTEEELNKLAEVIEKELLPRK